MVYILANLVPAVLIAFSLQVIFHEFGHMIFGKLTGWKLLYLQIYNRAIVKSENKYRIKHLSTHKFQCIMYPEQFNNNAILYTLGGCIFNLFSAVISLILMAFMRSRPVLWFYAWCFFVSGIVLFFSNIIPKTERLCNDGACYKLLKADERIIKIHNRQLYIAKELYQGKTYKQIDKKCICTILEHADNDITAYQVLLEYYYWLDKENYELMQKALLKVNMDANISQSISNIICMERLYIKLLLGIRSVKPMLINQSEFDHDINAYIKKHEADGDIHSYRIKTLWEVYGWLLSGNFNKINTTIETSIQYIRNMDCIYEGEVIFCIDQLSKINYRFLP